MVVISNNFRISDPPITFHCYSKDDELGTHTSVANQDFSWHFKPSFWENTMFACHFWWNGKDKSFEVYNRGLVDYHCNTVTDACHWIVQSDGFYLGSDIQRPFDLSKTQKMYGW
ncbi:hypothetical protein Leryth_013785 [Lithospermum erythrorhizon]|nr:hypothetical protein Leryth_013785 [Lithospermum erythrorhizon]